MRNFPGLVIGITGSYGKSSTKELLAQVLSLKYKVAKTEGNDNSEIGVAQRVLKLAGNEEVFIAEMGAYSRGEIRSICEIVKPKIGIITGIGDQHLGLFGSLEDIKKTKYELVESLPKDDLGLVADVDFSLKDVKNLSVFTDHVEFLYGGQKFKVPVLGGNQVRNLVAVIKVASHLGLSLPEIAKQLLSLDPRRISPYLLRGKNGSYIIDNSYNASVEAFLSLLEYLTTWKGYAKIVVTPGMIELGSNAEKDHLLVGKRLKVADAVFVTNPNYFRKLNYWGNASLILDRSQLLAKLKEYSQKRSVILFINRVPKVLIDSLVEDESL